MAFERVGRKTRFDTWICGQIVYRFLKPTGSTELVDKNLKSNNISSRGAMAKKVFRQCSVGVPKAIYIRLWTANNSLNYSPLARGTLGHSIYRTKENRRFDASESRLFVEGRDTNSERIAIHRRSLSWWLTSKEQRFCYFPNTWPSTP